MYRSILTILSLSALIGACGGLPPAGLVRTEQGVVSGTPAKVDGVTAYLGLPYAAAPVGEARWKAPGQAVAWQGVRAANTFGHRCIQTNPFPDMIWNSAAESEDCLYLSIWTPDDAEKLPVMVWIHGGGYASGSGDEERHDGSVLASKGAVIVTINYRLGLMGFFAHPELTAESETGSSGNYGLLDMLAALRWVQKNIGGFGGDPGNVTIFGESAGSFAVSALMASPLASGLFHKAIGQSGGQFMGDDPTLSGAETDGARFATAVGAASLTELRAKDAARLVNAVTGRQAGYAPVIDGYLLPESPLEIFESGGQNDVPLMAGWTSAETKWVNQSLGEFLAVRRERFPDHAELAASLYPAETEAEAYRMAITMSSDSWIVYPTWKWIELQGLTGDSAVYRYLFDQVMATPAGPVPDSDPGAAHATDIPFVFNTLAYTGNPIGTGDQAVTDLMADYWTNFARSGNPNGPGLPEWPVFEKETGNRVMRLSDSPGAEPESDRARMEFLDLLASRLADNQ